MPLIPEAAAIKATLKHADALSGAVAEEMKLMQQPTAEELAPLMCAYIGFKYLLPGAVGAADWLFVDMCGNYFSDPVSFNLLSRGISFYCNVAICGLLTWFWLLRHKKSQSAAVRSHHGKGEKL